MQQSEFLHELEEILEVDSGRLNTEVKLADLEGWNSLGVISFIAMVDEKTGMAVNARSIQRCMTVGDLMGLLGDAIT